MLKISIPTPCHEDWNKMTPDQTGRYCSVCVKSVVDFTNMSDEEVKHFFLNKKEDERVCGRFKQTQLHRIIIELPQNIFSIQMPVWKKFLAACLIVFSTTLFSCETKIQGALEMSHAKMEKPIQSNETDYAGGVVVTYDSVPVKTCDVTVGYSIPILKGDVYIEEPKPLSPNIPDTIPVPRQKNELIIVGDTIYEELPVKKLKIITPDTIDKTKNPPKADSIKCNTIKNYH